jgi:hypothetical protein
MAVAKQVSRFEDRYKISSEDFFHRFSGGHMEDTAEFAEWSNAYQHFLSLRNILKRSESASSIDPLSRTLEDGIYFFPPFPFP